VKKTLKRIGWLAMATFVVIQFIRPDRNNPESNPEKNIEAVLKVPADISVIMDRACRDCHSNNTVWPWYSNIAPVSWVIARDVTGGRRHLNFSEWGNYEKKRMIKKLSEIGEEVAGQSMPLPKYLLLHSEAKLTQQERKVFSDWAEKESDKMDSKVSDKTN
jgi:hypothetical protein